MIYFILIATRNSTKHIMININQAGLRSIIMYHSTKHSRDSLEDDVVDEGADALTGLLCVGCSSSVSRVSPFSVPTSLCSVPPLSELFEEQLLDSTLPRKYTLKLLAHRTRIPFLLNLS